MLPEEMSFKDACQKYVSENSYRWSENYKRQVRNLILSQFQKWNFLKLPDLNRSEIFNHILERQEKVENSTINLELTILKSILKNAGAEVKIRFLPEKKDRKRIMEPEEVEKLIWCADDFCFKCLLKVLQATLARVQEVLNAKWSDIDWYNRLIYLRTMKTGGRGEEEHAIPLNREATRILKILHLYRGNKEYIFPSWTKSKLYAMLHKTAKEAGVGRIGFHHLRHHSASRLAAEGVPLSDIQTLLRHRSINTTQIYIQSLRPSLRKAVNLLE